MNEEEKHLAYTKKYMEYILQETLESLGKYKGNIREALAELDNLDSSLNYTTALSNTRFLEMATKEADTLERLIDKPYFARIDFQRKGQQETDTYYLGKTSLYEKETQEPIIVDWRSPIANVYYDGRLGDVSYESYEGEIEGNLSLKRQFKIEEGKLIDYVDVDMMVADDLLLEALSGHADNRLTEIITTIQAEQNRAIRADLTKPIIIQGAAGSGKTTIALHRLSYFIYRYKDRFQPEQLMILAPNQMFLGYIADVLPELGVEKIRQTTYIDYVKKCIGGKVKVINPKQKLISLIYMTDTKDKSLLTWLSQFKGSFTYKKVIDRYLKDIRKQLTPTEDFYLEKYRLVSKKRLQHLFLIDYNYLPFYKRLEKIENVLKTDVRQKKKQISDKLAKKYDDYLDYALEIKNAAKRREKVVQAMDDKEERVKTIALEAKTAVKNYIKKIPRKTLLDYYKELFSNKERFRNYTSDVLSEEQINFFLSYNNKRLEKSQVEMEDLAALFYMQAKIFGIKKELLAKNVVIDEAQDYSNFQLYALKAGLETDLFTIVGDLAQGIYAYRGLRSFETLKKVFPEANYVTLQKSYRTTVEIMNVANDILNLMGNHLPQVEPVVRHGEKPLFLHYQNKNEFITNVQWAMKEIEQAGLQSIAFIGKTDDECKKIEKVLKGQVERPIQLLKENEDMKQDHLIIVPSYLSKGLEFDVVLLAVIDETFTVDDIDIKLLYVAMTRPMHRLYFIAKDKQDLLLNVTTNIIEK